MLADPAPLPAVLEFKTALGTARIVESASELPTRPGAHRMWLDAETTSQGRHNDPAVHPYNGDRACGWAVTWDDIKGAWYVPYRHSAPGSNNLDPEAVKRWLRDLIADPALEWENAFVKFDAHVAAVDGAIFKGTLGCLTTRAKLLNSDRWSHGLKSLCKDWLGLDMSEADEVQQYLAGIPMPTTKACNDFGRVPIDILGRYACMDVMSARVLGNHVRKKLPTECQDVYDQETLLTPVLWDMEHEGLLVDMRQVKIEEIQCLRAMISAQELVFDELGCDLTDSNKCMQDVMLAQLGLPILAWNKDKTKDGRRNPSFDKDAMSQYAHHPRVVSDAKTKRVVDAIRSYRTQSRFKGLYVDSFKAKVDDDGRIHPSYTQSIRTGRMACSDPNGQQFNTRAKTLIKPLENEAVYEADASQAEFRTIAHITRDDDAIAAYNNDPNTDYHQWVADLCGIGRKPAKTMNFLMAFGGGKRRATKTLMSNEDIVEEMAAVADQMIEDGRAGPDHRASLLEKLCERRAVEVWDTYHLNLPGIRFTSKRATGLVKRRGYVRNAYGRRRHLPPKAAHKAFNTYVQGTTMDVIKERMCGLSPRYNDWTREQGIRLNLNCHDSVAGYGPIDVLEAQEIQTEMKRILSDVQRSFRVPYLWDLGVSRHNLAEAAA